MYKILSHKDTILELQIFSLRFSRVKEDTWEEKKPGAIFVSKNKIQENQKSFIFIPWLNNSTVLFFLPKQIGIDYDCNR